MVTEVSLGAKIGDLTSVPGTKWTAHSSSPFTESEVISFPAGGVNSKTSPLILVRKIPAMAAFLSVEVLKNAVSQKIFPLLRSVDAGNCW